LTTVDSELVKVVHLEASSDLFLVDVELRTVLIPFGEVADLLPLGEPGHAKAEVHCVHDAVVHVVVDLDGEEVAALVTWKKEAAGIALDCPVLLEVVEPPGGPLLFGDAGSHPVRDLSYSNVDKVSFHCWCEIDGDTASWITLQGRPGELSDVPCHEGSIFRA